MIWKNRKSVHDRPEYAPEIDVKGYDHIIVCFSGGKDSIACVLHLLDLGIDRSRIELWHHDIDGNEGSTLMDWPFMRDYVRKFAEAMNMPVYYSWLEGGFEGEMLKQNAFSKSHKIETPDGLITLDRDHRRAKRTTRMRFPQQSASLTTRWCSSALKVDVGRRSLNNQSRFDGKRVLFITGERREESPNRAKYSQLEEHACDRRRGRKARVVDAWRPVLDWDEQQVWDALERHQVRSPVPYRLGWPRSSCRMCIFNDDTIWATINRYYLEPCNLIAGYEAQFGCTISRTQRTVKEIAQCSQSLEISDKEALRQSYCKDYYLEIFIRSDQWASPPGAFKSNRCGSL